MASDFRRKEELPELTDRLVESYNEIGTINHLGHCPLPRHEEIVASVQDLKEIIYPGYRRREKLHMGNIAYYVGQLVDSLHDRLTEQIARALRHEEKISDRENEHIEKVDYEAEGQRLIKTLDVPAYLNVGFIM